jgi:two-component system cell cycle response regulator
MARRESILTCRSASKREEEDWRCGPMDSTCRYQDEIRELRQQVVTDPLTQLYNTRFLHLTLERELERTRRTGIATSLIMIDLDHFKSVNDQYGHSVGNQVLQHTAQVILAGTRSLDVQCRFGGEEFAIVLPSCTLARALAVAERVRQLLASTPVPGVDTSAAASGGTPLFVTASLGVAERQASEMGRGEDLIRQADECLYQAKAAGRNQAIAQQKEVSDTHVTHDEKDLMRSLFSADSK